MDKDEFYPQFNRIFAEVVQKGIRNIVFPSEEMIEASWKVFCQKHKHHDPTIYKGMNAADPVKNSSCPQDLNPFYSE